MLDAFYVEAIWIGGTAITVQPNPHLCPGVVCILRRDGSIDQHPIPESIDEHPIPKNEGRPDAHGSVDYEGQPSGGLDIHGSILQRDGSSDEHPIPKNEGRPSGDLDVRVQAHLLKTAAQLLCGVDNSTNELSTALVNGVAALSGSCLTRRHRRALESFMNSPNDSSGSELYAARHGVRALLKEVDRIDRLERLIVGPGLTVDDNRPHLDVVCAAIGPFAGPLSRFRIALLPGEADHVELYDVRVGERLDYPNGISVISRLPGYGPGTVRETLGRMDVGGTLVGRYLPGTTLAGQLRDGTDPTHPGRLSPNDLLGGVALDLGRTFPPLSCVYLFYRIAPGHVFCAVVEPIEPIETVMRETIRPEGPCGIGICLPEVTAHAQKPTITPDRITWFLEYLHRHPAWGAFHVTLDDGNWKTNVDSTWSRGDPGEDDAIQWFNGLTQSQRRRLLRRVEARARERGAG